MLRKAMFLKTGFSFPQLSLLWVAFLTVAVMGNLASDSARADTLIVDAISAEQTANEPARGETQADVVAEFGDPVSKNSPVGDPAISSWEYDSFVVYFENDYVLHAVAKR